jgi:HSP20 family molecular chaperone IbpA
MALPAGVEAKDIKAKTHDGVVEVTALALGDLDLDGL